MDKKNKKPVLFTVEILRCEEKCWKRERRVHSLAEFVSVSSLWMYWMWLDICVSISSDIGITEDKLRCNGALLFWSVIALGGIEKLSSNSDTASILFCEEKRNGSVQVPLFSYWGAMHTKEPLWVSVRRQSMLWMRNYCEGIELSANESCGEGKKKERERKKVQSNSWTR